MFDKCKLYHEWGVPYCWVIDGMERRVWECHRNHTFTEAAEKVNAGEIKLGIEELFSCLPQ